MKKIFIIFILLTLGCIPSIYAAYLVAFPTNIIQPDGSEYTCYISGDEYYNWLHDANNYTILTNDNGYYCYATIKDNKLCASEYVVGTVNPASVGLVPNINISADEKLIIRQKFIENTPDISTATEYKKPKELKSESTMNNLVIYIKFSDQTDFPEDTAYYWRMFNKDDDMSYQSLKNYFQQVSYNKLSISSTFYPLTTTTTILCYTDPNPRQYYMPYDAINAPLGYQTDDDRTSREHILLKNAVNYISLEVPVDLDIDYNDDGMVDNVVFVIKGAPTAWNTLLWPHRWALYTQSAYINGKRVWDFNLQLETHLNDSESSVLCHEMFHSLGAPDLYRYSNNTIEPVGTWDVMAGNTKPAQSMAAYLKYKYAGWINEIPEITKAGVYTLCTPYSQTKNMYKLASPNSNQEFFLLEFRNKKHPYEIAIPGEGLIIYRINPSIDGNAGGPPDEMYVFRPGGFNTTTNGALNQANFSANSSRTAFDNSTNPPCFLMDDSPADIFIKNIGSVGGDSITFEVWMDASPEADFKASFQEVTTDCNVDFFGICYYFIDQWSWEFQDGTPATSNLQNPTGIKFSSGGTKTVKLTVSNSHGSFTKTGSIFINTSSPAVADFYTYQNTTCINTPVYLFDNSSLCPITWEWSFQPNSVQFVNGTNNHSQNPVVVFSDLTQYDVSLTATNANGANTVTKEKYINSIGLNLETYSVDFEKTSSLEELGFTVINPDNKITWDLINLTSSQGTNTAMYMNFYDYPAVNQRDYVILPPVDINGIYEMHFKHAYTIRQNYSDTLIVSISTDCGNTWNRLATYYENGSFNFATAEPVSTAFIPADNQWCNLNCNVINLSKYVNTHSALIRFETFKTYGNNLYIDDISFVKLAGVENITPSNILIYPNPAKNTIFIDNVDGIYDVRVFDIVGNLVLSYNNMCNKGVINMSDCKKGVYFINVISDKLNNTVKIIKE